MRGRGSKLLPHFKTSAPIVTGATLDSFGAKRNPDGLSRTCVRRTSQNSTSRDPQGALGLGGYNLRSLPAASRRGE